MPGRLVGARAVVHHPAVLVFLAALALAVLSAAARVLRRASAPRQAPVSAELLRETILVVLVPPPGAGRLATRHLFDAAAVPSRVFLAVYADLSRGRVHTVHPEPRAGRHRPARAWL